MTAKCLLYTPLEDACESCGIRCGVVIIRYTGELLCWGCYNKRRKKGKTK